MKLKRLNFTLIEMLMVLSIVAVVAGVIAINMQKAFADQRFKSELAAFVDHLRLAQDLTLMADADVHFKIQASAQEKGIKYWIETDRPFSKSFDRLIKKVGVLKSIHHVSHPNSKDGLIDLEFLSKGSKISSGTIQLCCGEKNDHDKMIAHITLKGYPSPIFASEKKIEFAEDSKDLDMPLIQATMQEIQTIQNEKKQTP